MEVLEDFKEDYDPRKELEGILKVGDFEFDIEDGVIKTFGKDVSCDYIIPCEEVDSTQFQLQRFGNDILLVDTSNNWPTRIKVDPDKAYKLCEGDYIDFGFCQVMRVLECASE